MNVFLLKAVVLGPLFLVSLGVVLFLNGLQLYAFFLTNSSDEGSAIGSSDNSTDINLFCVDARANGQNEIFGEERYVLIEFVGALVSVLFFVSLIATSLSFRLVNTSYIYTASIQWR